MRVMVEPIYNIIDFISSNVTDPNSANRNNTDWVLVADAVTDSTEPIYTLLDDINNFPLITVRQYGERAIVSQLPATDLESTVYFDVDIFTVESLILSNKEGSKLIQDIARDVINQIRDNWSSDADLSFMYDYEVIQNEFVGYDPDTGLYHRRVKIKTTAINIA